MKLARIEGNNEFEKWTLEVFFLERDINNSNNNRNSNQSLYRQPFKELLVFVDILRLAQQHLKVSAQNLLFKVYLWTCFQQW